MNKRKLEIFVDTHLQLCEVCVSDAGTIYRAIDLHRDDLRRWLPFVDGLHSVAEEKNFLSGLCAEVPELRNYTFKILFEGVFCGLVGFVLPIRSIVRPRSGTGCYRNFAGGASCLVVLRDCVYGRSMSGR